jgi:hypothetical protein
VKLPTTSTVYIGTHYEYTVHAALARLGMRLTRVGGRADAGIDLLGQWLVPWQQQQQQQQQLSNGHLSTAHSTPSTPLSISPAPHSPFVTATAAATTNGDGGGDGDGAAPTPCLTTAESAQALSRPPSPSSSSSLSSPSLLHTLVQCKVLHRRPGPQLVRELEGAFSGAPLAWRRRAADAAFGGPAELARGLVEDPASCSSPSSSSYFAASSASADTSSGTPSLDEGSGSGSGSGGGSGGAAGNSVGILALLAVTREATAGVRKAMRMSRLPLAFALVRPDDGRVLQFLWNRAASDAGLHSLGVTTRYVATSAAASSSSTALDATGAFTAADAAGPVAMFLPSSATKDSGSSSACVGQTGNGEGERDPVEGGAGSGGEREAAQGGGAAADKREAAAYAEEVALTWQGRILSPLSPAAAAVSVPSCELHFI